MPDSPRQIQPYTLSTTGKLFLFTGISIEGKPLGLMETSDGILHEFDMEHVDMWITSLQQIKADALADAAGTFEDGGFGGDFGGVPELVLD